MQDPVGRVIRAIFWGCIPAAIAGGIGGFVVGFVRGPSWVCLLDCFRLSAKANGTISAVLMLFPAAILGVAVGLVTGLLKRPKLTWLLGPLLGVLAAIVFGMRDDRPEQLVLSVTGLIAALVAGWRMTPRHAK